MPEIKFGSKQHIKNLINVIEISIKRDIGRKEFLTQDAARVCGMIEAILCLAMPSKFAPGKKFKYNNVVIQYKTLFGKQKEKTRRESYTEMLLRNLKGHYNSIEE